ncbi:Mitochondrial matrix iron chaperone [Batrachochytrium dendrobatidis]
MERSVHHCYRILYATLSSMSGMHRRTATTIMCLKQRLKPMSLLAFHHHYIPLIQVHPLHPIRYYSKAPNTIQSAHVPLVSHSTTLSENDYHKFANVYLNSLLEYLEELGDSIDMDGFDVVYSSGVLTLKLGDHGIFVINKQPPNKQVWLSSPVSGPKRYDYEAKTGKWIYARDQHSLEEVINEELSNMLQQKVNWKPPSI